MGLDICFITGQFYPSFGGVGVHTYELAKAMVDEGNEVKVITPLIGSQRESEELQGIGITRLKPSSLPLSTILYYRKAAMEAERTHRGQGFDVVHGQWLGCLFTRRENFPNAVLIQTLHGTWLDEREGLRGAELRLSGDAWTYQYFWPIFAYAERRACENAHQVIVVSEQNRSEAVKHYSLGEDRVSVIPNGVDVNRFNPNVDGGGIRRRLRLEDRQVILFVGGLRDRKGIPYLMQAMKHVRKEVPDSYLVICGEGSQRSSLEEMSRELGISEYTIFTGEVPYEDLPKYYAACDLFVLPSNYEAQGIVLLEAMSSQRAVVATRVGGIPETVGSDVGILVPPRDPSTLAQAMLTLLKDPELRLRMGRAGRKKASGFDWRKIASKTIELYKRCIETAE
jgi:glycosyltransferase involved in cell wall biosynthesis